MNERADRNGAKARAARIDRKLVRSQSLRRVTYGAFALFALVFALLSFRLTAGLDPSSSGTSVATTSQPQTSETQSESADDETLSADSTTSTGTSSTQAPAAPTSGAS